MIFNNHTTMNIFVLDYNATKAAKYHCDKHCVKMVLELYQQLGSAVRRHGATDKHMPLTQKGTPLKGGYHNHPCTVWVGTNQSNYLWAVEHALALCEEYTYRYNKVHNCNKGILHLSKLYKLLPTGSKTPFAQAMPEEFRNKSNAVKAYRKYYLYDKRFNIDCSWRKKRTEPKWWSNAINKE